MLVLMHLCFLFLISLGPIDSNPFVLSSHQFLLLLVSHQTAFAKKYANIVLILFNKMFALLCSLHLKPSLLKYVLCSPCLAFFPAWPFAILVLHSVLLKLSIFNLSLSKFLSFSPHLFQLFLLGFSVTLSFVDQIRFLVCFLLFPCASMDIPILKLPLDGSAFPLDPLFSLNIRVIPLVYIFFFYCGQLSDNCSCCLFEMFCLQLITQSYLCLLDSCLWCVSIQGPQ